MKKTTALLAALLLASAGMTAVQAPESEPVHPVWEATRHLPEMCGMTRCSAPTKPRHTPFPMSPLSREPVPSGIPIRQVSALWSYPVLV